MDSVVEEPSYLGGSPRHHPLPTISINHANLVSPIKQLDLSDEDSADDSENNDAGQPMVEVKITEASDVVEPEMAIGDSATTSASSIASSVTISEAPVPGESAVASKTNAETAKVKKIKPAGRVVASRYMAEAEKSVKISPSDQTRPQQKPATPQRPNAASQRTTPQRTTPQSSKAKPTPSGSVKLRTPTGSAKPRTQSASTPSAATSGSEAAGGANTPKSSKNEDGGLPREDMEIINCIMARTKVMVTLHIEDCRKAFLEQATSVLTASAVAIGQLCGKKNENALALFQAQCELKMISLHSATKDVLLEKSQMDQTKAHLAKLEQALLSKGRNLECSGSIELPMSDDKTGQAALVKKLVQKLKTQMDVFRAIDNALPQGVRETTKNLAHVLGELDGVTIATSKLFEECARHLRACLHVLVEFIYLKRAAPLTKD